MQARLKIEIAVGLDAALDPYALAGLFNRFRPDGEGLERLFGADPVQQAVLTRIRHVFEATASSWKPGDLYFVVREAEAIDCDRAQMLASAHVTGLEKVAQLRGDTQTQRALAMLRKYPDRRQVQAVAATLMYECFTDFLAQFQPAQDEVFLLKEALYSMANDYYLMAYMLWPAIRKATGLPDLLDPYAELWRHGVRIAGDGGND